MSPVAAIDCGTNSIRLLVAELGGGDRLHELDRRLEIVRLGQDVDATGRFAADALRRTFAACDRYAEVVARVGARAVRFCATSAARDVANRDEFAAGVRVRFGVDPEVLTGGQEARLSYDGATRELRGRLPAPYLVLDIGGGSTEVVLGDRHGAVRAAESLDVGSVRMTERHLRDDPPTLEQVGAATCDVDTALDRVGVPLQEARTLVGVAGTVTTLAAMVLDLPTYDRDRVHLARLAIPEVVDAVDRLLAMPRERRCRLGFLHPGRVDVIGAGALILRCVLRRVETTLAEPVLVASEHDLLDGIAWSLLDPP